MNYIPPTSAEVRDMLERMQLSNEEAGKPVVISGRQMRRYTSEGSEKSVMPFAILYTLVHRLYGQVLTPENWRNELVYQRKDSRAEVARLWNLWQNLPIPGKDNP